MSGPPRFRRLAMVARWRPVHLGHRAALEGLLAATDELWIGIGSANRYDVHNPFTAAETRAMLELVLHRATSGSGSGSGSSQSCRITIVEVPDLGDPPRWAAMVAAMVGDIDAFVTANEWVRGLMAGRFRVLHPVSFVPPADRVRIDGTMVRLAMARAQDWRALVPPAIADYIVEHALDERFRREFGALALELHPESGAAGPPPKPT